jgi:AbrB family looped-hinge helix DNA binding protein
MASMLKVSPRGTMTLPKRLREKFGLKRGGSLVMEETPLGVLLRNGRKRGKVELYTPARLAEFERNNEAPLAKLKLG